MKVTLEKISANLSMQQSIAEEKMDSENEDTANKYQEVYDALQNAIDAVDEALSALKG